MNSISLRRKGKVHVKPGSGGATIEHLAMVRKEAEHPGFVLSERLSEQLRSLSAEQLAQFLRSLLRDLRALAGAHRAHEPLYPGFPQQVLGLSEAQLYLNAISHYLTLRRLPRDEDARPPLLRGKATRESLAKPDLHTLFDLHVRARGMRVESPESADTVFSVSQGITPFEVDRIRAQFL